ncbi:hypothetical protein [uncultured Alistipes sp.]|uniref:hypothetical protein n=1 Tax=uncultured Alistipes sp. TaxID=538949 RepID=UPI0026163ED4|nr:hypothetical protein [uncultured Alistipes sp.]
MNKRILFFSVLLPLSLFGQQTTHRYSFDANIKYYADAFDVELAVPEGMVDLNASAAIRIRKEYRLAFCGGPLLQSEDRECVLMYKSNPLFISENLHKSIGGINNDQAHRNLISSELGTVHGYCDELGGLLSGKTFPFDEYVSAFPEEQAREWFNADSVFVYDLPVDDPYQGIYNHCTGVVITKKGRTGFALKLYFTDEGKKNEKRYLQSLRKTIWYRDTEWKYDRENDKRAIRKHWDGVSE